MSEGATANDELHFLNAGLVCHVQFDSTSKVHKESETHNTANPCDEDGRSLLTSNALLYKSYFAHVFSLIFLLSLKLLKYLLRMQ